MSATRLGSLLIVDDEAESLVPLLDLVSNWGYEDRQDDACRV